MATDAPIKVTESVLEKALALIQKRNAMVKRFEDFRAAAHLESFIDTEPARAEIRTADGKHALPVLLTREALDILTETYDQAIGRINKEIQALGITTIDQEHEPTVDIDPVAVNAKVG